MPVIVVSGSEAGAGATTVAAGLAHRLAYAGHRVRVERLAFGANAERDAATFGMLEFASSAGRPVQAGAISPDDGVTVIDASMSPDAGTIAGALGAVRVAVMLAGHVGGTTTGAALVIENHAAAGGQLRLPEDRLLAAPTVGTLIAASRARVVARSTEGERAICEHIVIGAISHDSDQPYFARFPHKVVVTRAEKVDIALSALRTDAECLILTGGSDPSPYVLDRVAASRGTTLLVAPEGTVETVRDIEGTFGRSAFSSDAKVERIGMLMASAVSDDALTRLVGG
ncbi:MAG: DRTGG domain-containing protein [Dehalococcoidia bacterium]